MHEKPAELVDVVRSLIDALEAAGVPYAIGGAIALAAWSEPRATKDVDVTLFVDESVPDAALDALESAGLDFVREAARAEAERRGMFVLRSPDGYRVDVFVASILLPSPSNAGAGCGLPIVRLTCSTPRASPSSRCSSSDPKISSTSHG